MTADSRRKQRADGRDTSRVSLISARSRLSRRAHNLSRFEAADGYSKLRRKRTVKKRIVVSSAILLSTALIAVLVGGVYCAILNGKLATDMQGNTVDFSSSVWEGTFTEPEKPEDPFWMLLMGTDETNESELPRTDTLILARIDQANKTAALLSIPRDTYVDIPGYGKDKINAAYAYGEQERKGGGAPLAIKTVSAFAGVDISYFAQVGFSRIKTLVDGLGGVWVDVPLSIIGDRDAGNIDVLAGYQQLNGEQALIFCRSRKFTGSDYQRQANQRTFLQATARQILSSSPGTIATTVNNLAEMTFTNMDLGKIVKVAQGMQGLQESNIHTYTVPSTTDSRFNSAGEKISYVIAYDDQLAELIKAIESGKYPARQDSSEYYAQTEVPDAYIAGASTGNNTVIDSR
ncbi:MAG TPA: hypothetical protein DEB24_08130 [Coriobacteriia bacterium]|nr:hypothetical protein [Coriobacteriia bacterium]